MKTGPLVNLQKMKNSHGAIDTGARKKRFADLEIELRKFEARSSRVRLLGATTIDHSREAPKSFVWEPATGNVRGRKYRAGIPVDPRSSRPEDRSAEGLNSTGTPYVLAILVSRSAVIPSPPEVMVNPHLAAYLSAAVS